MQAITNAINQGQMHPEDIFEDGVILVRPLLLATACIAFAGYVCLNRILNFSQTWSSSPSSSIVQRLILWILRTSRMDLHQSRSVSSPGSCRDGEGTHMAQILASSPPEAGEEVLLLLWWNISIRVLCTFVGFTQVNRLYWLIERSRRRERNPIQLINALMMTVKGHYHLPFHSKVHLGVCLSKPSSYQID